MTATPLTPDELLSTTRSVRKRLDLDRPVDLASVRECLELALQAPTGSNAQGWHFVVVTDADKRRQIGEYYRKAFEIYASSPEMAERMADVMKAERAEQQQMGRVVDSARYLAENLGRVPVFVIPCVQGRTDAGPAPMPNLWQASIYGSILPAAWSFMLAARSRGLGTAWTTLHLASERETAELLGIPYDEVMQTALIPVAHVLGTGFRPARRRPLDSLLHVDAW